LIIGIGNPVRGDDGLGWHAVQQLTALGLPEHASVLACQQLTMDLVEPVHEAERVVFIDARQGEPVGAFTRERVQPSSALSEPVSHFFDPGTLLACVQALYGAHPEAVLFSISSTHFDYVETLSPPVASALPALLDDVRALIMEASMSLAKILVVDDDPDFVEIIRMVLEKADYEVVSASSGDQALKQIMLEKPDLMLLDVMMATVTDGLDLTERLRDDPVLSHLPVIIVSSMADTPHSGLVSMEAAIHMEAWISKPVDPKRLLELVKKALA